MLKAYFIIILGTVFLLSLPTFGSDTTKQKDSISCFGEIGPILSAGGYSGDLNCDSIQVEISKVGTITISSNAYAVYDLRYRTIHSAGMVVHGGQRIIVILNGKTYLGQYSLSPPPLHKVTIEGNSIFIDVPPQNGNKITIGKSGPPVSAFLDQDEANFYK
jgi:hypothetical protein